MLTSDSTAQEAAVIEAPTSCKNCGTALGGHFCADCGQKDKHLDPSLHDLLHELVHEFVHLDGKIAKTLKALVFSPGRLTSEFLDGRRARYIGPVRLYLTFSLLFFLVAAYKAEPVVVQGDNTVLTLTENKKKVADLDVQVKDGNDGWLDKHIERVVAKANNNPELVRHALATNISRLMFVLVPLFALGLRFAYRNRNRRYPAFVYFSLHYHAFAFLALTLYSLSAFTHVGIIESVVGYAVALWLPLYLFMALRRVFGGSKRKTALRMVALACLYVPSFAIGFLVASVITLLTL